MLQVELGGVRPREVGVLWQVSEFQRNNESVDWTCPCREVREVVKMGGGRFGFPGCLSSAQDKVPTRASTPVLQTGLNYIFIKTSMEPCTLFNKV